MEKKWKNQLDDQIETGVSGNESGAPKQVSKEVLRLVRLTTNFEGEIAKLPPEKRQKIEREHREARERRLRSETSPLLDVRLD